MFAGFLLNVTRMAEIVTSQPRQHVRRVEFHRVSTWEERDTVNWLMATQHPLLSEAWFLCFSLSVNVGATQSTRGPCGDAMP